MTYHSNIGEYITAGLIAFSGLCIVGMCIAERKAQERLKREEKQKLTRRTWKPSSHR